MSGKMYQLQLGVCQHTITDPISYADAGLYPNVHVILKLLQTLPVGSCACERSFSALRRLKTWCRAILTEDRLCWLAMLHVHRNDTVWQVNPEAILKRCAMFDLK